jgi:hypothetical protein
MVRGTPAPDYPATWSREMYEEYFERIEHAWGTDAFVREVVEMLSPRSCTTRPPCERTGDSYGSAPARETRSPAIAR